MFDFIKRDYRKNYRFYRKNLSNFKTVMKDTDNNLATADSWEYNCMSYALGIFDNWLGLRAFEHSIMLNDDNENFIDYEYLNDVFHACCEELEEKFAVRRVSGPNARLKANERMIAFRIGADDFHFARRNSDGIWTHKPGHNYIREMSKEELFSDAWSKKERRYPYISDTAFFAVII